MRLLWLCPRCGDLPSLVRVREEAIMFEPEYRVGFRVLTEQIALWPTLKVVIPATLKSLRIDYETDKDPYGAERTKAEIKHHFKLLALMYEELQKHYGTQRTNEIMHEVLMKAGPVFFRGFTPLGPNDDLTDFAKIYKRFERHNLVFDVREESKDRLEIVVRRCLVYESFNELGLVDLTPWMCDIAYAYFESYHPKIKYTKDRMIARGDDTCHEVFVWGS
jgi:hypothetical protein